MLLAEKVETLTLGNHGAAVLKEPAELTRPFIRCIKTPEKLLKDLKAVRV